MEQFFSRTTMALRSIIHFDPSRVMKTSHRMKLPNENVLANEMGMAPKKESDYENCMKVIWREARENNMITLQSYSYVLFNVWNEIHKRPDFFLLVFFSTNNAQCKSKSKSASGSNGSERAFCYDCSGFVGRGKIAINPRTCLIHCESAAVHDQILTSIFRRYHHIISCIVAVNIKSLPPSRLSKWIEYCAQEKRHNGLFINCL